MAVDGPAAGDAAAARPSDDPSGKRIVGTLNNCAGGMTPWGTYLTAEENFHVYFWTDQSRCRQQADARGSAAIRPRATRATACPGLWQAWGKFHDRFNVDKEPNEPNRFGWIVEIDPFDANFVPVKHTALGRFCHEGAETVLNKRRSRRRLLRRRYARRICLSLRLRAAATTRTTARPICRCCRRARSTVGALRRRRHRAHGCRSIFGEAMADAGLRVQLASRCVDRREARR